MRFLSISVVAVAAALAAALAQVGTADGYPAFELEASSPVIASATGSGHFTFGTEFRSFSFSAREHADGTDEGQMQLRNRGLQNTPIHIELDCLRVTGNTATASGTVTHIGTPTPPFFVVGSRAAFTVVDNGEGQLPPDLISLTFFFGPLPSPLNCNALFFAPTNQVTSGNVQVRS